MSYIDKLINKFNKVQSKIDSLKGISAKLQSINYNTAIDALGEQKSEALERIKERRDNLKNSLSAGSRSKDFTKQMPSGQVVEYVYPFHDDLANYLVFDIRKRKDQGNVEEASKIVSLYIPDNLASAVTVSYTAQSVGPLARAFDQIAGAIGTRENDLAQAVGDNADAITGGMISKFVNQLSGGLSNLKAGKAVNPMEEQQLDGLPFREFSFEFTFAPRSAEEANQMNNIIYTFRNAMLPNTFDATLSGEKDVTAKDGYFNYPNVVDVYLDGPIAKKVDGFLPCVITQCDIDHTGGNKFVTFDDGTPVIQTMTLGIREIRILSQQNYNIIAANKGLSQSDREKLLAEDNNSIVDTVSRTGRDYEESSESTGTGTSGGTP